MIIMEAVSNSEKRLGATGYAEHTKERTPFPQETIVSIAITYVVSFAAAIIDSLA